MEGQEFEEDEASMVYIVRKTIEEQVVTPSFKAMKQTTSIMIVDDMTMKLLTACMKMQHLNEMGVGAIMHIDFEREKVRIPPIYFLSPSLDSVQALVADYADEFDTQYGKPIHVYFCGVLSQECVDLIQNSQLSDWMKNYREVYCDFLPLEDCLYSFERPNAIHEIWISQAVNAREKELRRCAENLVSVVCAMDEDPYIIYPKTSEVATDFAAMFENIWSKKKGKLSADFEPVGERGTLIILDRSQDAAVPLMHDYSYQAMIHDYMNVDGAALLMPGEDGAEPTIFKFADDPIWEFLQLENMSAVNTIVKEKFNNWKANSACAKAQGKDDPESVAKAIRDLPKYKKFAASFNTHFSIYGELSKKFKELNLQEIGDFEQAMATNIHEVNDKYIETKKDALFETLKKFVADKDTDKVTKTRLLMIYLLSQGGPQSSGDVSRMFDGAELTKFQQKAVNNLPALGYPLSAEAPAPKKMFKELTMARAKELYEEMYRTEVLQSRFEPEMAHVLRMQLDEPAKLTEHFAFQGDQPNLATDSNKKVNLYEKEGTGPKTIIFIIGGVTYSEVRMAYLIGEERDRDVYIGGTSTLTAKQYMEAIAGMKEGSEE